MDTSFIVVALTFALGFFVVPSATKELLVFKYQEINRAWNESLREYSNHVMFTHRKPKLNSERVERSMAQWGDRQIVLVNAGKLSFEKVCALRSAGVIDSPKRGRDPAADLPREQDVAASYRICCTVPMRLVCGSLLAFAAVLLTYSSVGAAGIAAGLVAGAAMEATYLCDMHARIIPYQLCLVFGAAGIVFAFATSGLHGLTTSVATALFMYLGLRLTNSFMQFLSGSPAIGTGDLRFIPMICIFSGLAGTLYGFLGASVVMALIAAVTVLFKNGSRKSYVPYAPGLSCWYAIGLIAQVAACA